MESEVTQGQFYNPSKGNLGFAQVIEEIKGYMNEQPGLLYEVVVGCDSPSSDRPFFPIAVVVLRKGFGGRFFLKKMHYPDNFLKRFVHVPTNWKQRILQEVYLSCELALTLRETLEKELGRSDQKSDSDSGRRTNYQFTYIHADVGEHGKTKEMVKEVTGLIKGSGFEPMIKPFSFAASVVADRYT